MKAQEFNENYPVSIPLDEVFHQYADHDSAFDFDYDMSFATRVGGGRMSFHHLLEDNQKAEEYLKLSVETLATLGMRFFDEFSPLLSFKAMTKHADRKITGNWNLMPEIARYLITNKIQIPEKACGAPPLEVAESLDHLAVYYDKHNAYDAAILREVSQQLHHI